MCICINCRHIHKCKTYLFITKQHNKSHILLKQTFNPINNIINVNIKIQSKEIILDWDLIECLSFIEKPGHWLKKKYNHH